MNMPDFDDIENMDIKEIEGGLAIRMHLKNKGSSEDKDVIVKKSLPAKPEWIKEFDSLHEETDHIGKMIKRASARRSKLWAEVELSLESYGNLRYNDSLKEIEICGNKNDSEEKKKRLIKSPIQPGR